MQVKYLFVILICAFIQASDRPSIRNNAINRHGNLTLQPQDTNVIRVVRGPGREDEYYRWNNNAGKWDLIQEPKNSYDDYGSTAW